MRCKRIIMSVISILLLSMAAGLCSCQSEPADVIPSDSVENTVTMTPRVPAKDVTPPEIVRVSGIYLGSESLAMKVGETLALETNISPENATNTGLIWTTNRPDIAAVTGDGTVRAVSVGSATITAVTKDGGYMAYCEVSVRSVPVTDVKLNAEELLVFVDGTETLAATIEPEDATNQNLRWTSSDESIVKVEDGTLTGVSEGKATVTVTTLDGNKTASCEITVEIEPIDAEKVSFSSETVTMTVGEVSELAYVFEPEEANNKKLEWISSDPAVAVAEAGKITAVGEGSATILLRVETEENGILEASCQVIVNPAPVKPVSGVKISQSTMGLKVGDSGTLNAVVEPENASDKTVVWTTSDSSIAKVEAGVVTAVGEGSAVITASSADGKFQAVCQVTVSTREIPVTGILLSDTVVYLLEGERWLLTASVTPTDATNQELLWSSGNHDVATVDNGVLVAEDTGWTFITVTTADGNYRAMCSVFVEEDTDNAAEDFEYEIRDGTVTILSYSGSRKIMRIPSRIEGYEVKAIATDAFLGNETIRRVFLPDTVREIGSWAFAACTNLEEIYINNAEDEMILGGAWKPTYTEVIFAQ